MDSTGQKKATSSKNSTYTKVSPSKGVSEKSPTNSKRSPKTSKSSSSKATPTKSSKEPEPIVLPKNASNADAVVQDADGHPVDSSSIVPVKELAKRLQDRVDVVDPPSATKETMPEADLEKKTEERVDSPVSSEDDKENGITKAELDEDAANDNSKTVVMFEWPHTNAEKVHVAGSFNEWSDTSYPLELVDDVHRISISLEPGKYLFKYVVDGEWHYDITLPTEIDDEGNINNVVVV